MTDTTRYNTLIGLDVQDEDKYAQYRERMSPILNTYGGAFRYDMIVSEALRSEAPHPINRIFLMSFPTPEARVRFFNDEHYLKVRAEFFDPAVTNFTQIASYESDDGILG